MTMPLGKRTIMPKATRPWSARESIPEKPIHKDTAREKLEREICLNCELPECPDERCPIATPSINTAKKKPGQKKREMPQDFPQWAWKLTVKELSRHFGAGEKLIYRWRNELKNRP